LREEREDRRLVAEHHRSRCVYERVDVESDRTESALARKQPETHEPACEHERRSRRSGTGTTRAPAAVASSRDPSVLPLSATMTSPLIPYFARASRACFTQSATVAASFRHGMTIDSSRRWSKPVAMLARDPQPGGPHAIDIGERTDACADVVGHRVVEGQDHQRLAARVEASDLHRRDVHVVLAEQRPD